MRFLALPVFLAGLVGVGAEAYGQGGGFGSSFNCATAGNQRSIVTVVCRDEAALRADAEQIRAYYVLRHLYPNDIPRFRDEYNDRIREIVRGCSDASCAIARFRAMAEGWNARIRVSDNADAAREAETPLEDLRAAQILLRRLGLLEGDSAPNAVFGTRTRAAIAEFQRGAGLEPNGFLGARTWEALRARAEGRETERSVAAEAAPIPGDRAGTVARSATGAAPDAGVGPTDGGTEQSSPSRQQVRLDVPVAHVLRCPPANRARPIVITVCNDAEIMAMSAEVVRLYNVILAILPQGVPERTSFHNRRGRWERGDRNPHETCNDRDCFYAHLLSDLRIVSSYIITSGSRQAIDEAKASLPALRAVHHVLRRLDLIPADSRLDGIYNEAARAAIRRFQADRGLSVTGLVDEDTLDSFLAISLIGANVVQAFRREIERAEMIAPPPSMGFALSVSARTPHGMEHISRDPAAIAEVKRRSGLEEQAEQFWRRVAQQVLADRERVQAAERQAAMERQEAQFREREMERRRQAEAERARVSEENRRHDEEMRRLYNEYAARPKTLLEQIANYTFIGNEDGGVIAGRFVFFVSGHNGAHRCVLRRFDAPRPEANRPATADQSAGNPELAAWLNLEGLFVEALMLSITPIPEQFDIRSFNQDGFSVERQFVIDHIRNTVGDERVRFFAAPSVSERRLINAWRLAFRECPGVRRQF